MAAVHPLADIFPIPLEETDPRIAESKGKYPSFFETFRDPTWKAVTSYHLLAARKLQKTLHESLSIPEIRQHYQEANVKQLEKDLENISAYAHSYHQARQMTRKGSRNAVCQTLAQRICVLVGGYTNNYYLSNSAALKKMAELNSQKAHPGYAEFIKRQNRKISIHYPSRAVAPCSTYLRSATVNSVIAWLEGVGLYQAKRIFWLHGPEKCGKTTFSHFFAKLCIKQSALAAGFDFWCPVAHVELNHSFMFNILVECYTLLGKQFSDRCCEFHLKLTNREPTFFNRELYQQLRDVLTPAFKMLPVGERKPLIIVIDGMDKLDRQAVGELLEAIHYLVSTLPIFFFLTSQVTNVIEQALMRSYDLSPYVHSEELPSLPECLREVGRQRKANNMGGIPRSIIDNVADMDLMDGGSLYESALDFPTE